ncbi:glutathione S-transferase alpha-4, putative [Pediculus humanus corporis]|uniref:glutathione transferase n=1 Tax=Pediculus humanus subsp. corporis TaxID=121224 RepID=E0VL94_PEDHC|nr:glutathione S-transferase alpha-4, putative [Pediculus humanus corporis]EEB14150.1 glutathione S-transferase alpha-4, putative [Pediculus humanus corporis]
MAPKYKLTYFNFTGLGEPIRYMLAYGNQDFEDNRIEMADWPKLKPNYSAYFREPTEEGKAKKLEDVRNVHNPNFLSKFEERVKNNGGHFVNGQLTWADLYFSAVVDLMVNVLKEPILDKYPNLKALKEKVDSLPSIKAYREKRPKTLF